MRSKSGDKRPLVVDLDGTLLKTDVLIEAASRFVTHNPLRAHRLAGWLLSGRSVFKERLVEHSKTDPALLPYNEPLLAWLRDQKKQGRLLVLATASPRSVAQAVADHLGFFDDVLASEGGANLKSKRKRDELVSRYGDHGFDYVGNSTADLPVWASAQHAFIVSSSRRLVARARSRNGSVTIVDSDKKSSFRSLLKSLRPHQWVKNALVLLPLLTAHKYGDVNSVVQAALAFVVFCLAASGTYLLNDLVDLEHDRSHPHKNQRPFASGDLGVGVGWLIWPALVVAACVVAGLLLPKLLVISLAVYLVLTVFYSLRLRQVVLADALVLAGLYALRVAAGAFAIEVAPSFWLLAFSLFFFLSLALIKRYCELKSGGEEQAHGMRGRGYLRTDLAIVQSFGTSTGCIAVLVLALYIDDARTAELYRSPKFIWLACPLLLYWISRAWVIAHRGHMHDDPIIFALKDWVSWSVGICVAALFVLAGVIR